MSGIIDLFAGPGGFERGLEILGETDVTGIDGDAAAVATARAAGYSRLQDTLGRRPRDYMLESRFVAPRGIVAGPPCPGFSAAGLKLGRGDIPMILQAVTQMGVAPQTADGIIAAVRTAQTDVRSALSLEPLRWVLDLYPEWAVFEQVPSVLPLWEACATVLRAQGYAVWTGKVHAEQYGVPQTRTRAVLIAKRQDSAGRNLTLEGLLAPVPTHSRYHTHSPSRLDPDVQLWVSMAMGLGRGPGWRPRAANKGTTHDDMEWVYSRPAPTIVGSFRPDVAAKPAYRKAGDTPRQKAPGSVLLSVAEAGVLQSFPADYPWQGSVAKQYQQVGNAIPPLLAAAILKRVL